MITARPRFALSALKSLGLPCGLPLDQSGLALDVPTATATAALDAAYTRVMTVRRDSSPPYRSPVIEQAIRNPLAPSDNGHLAPFGFHLGK